MSAKTKLLLNLFAIVALAIAIAIVSRNGFAWTNPTSNPPGGGGVISVVNGNVGIGVSAPSEKLDVSGSIGFDATLQTDLLYGTYQATNETYIVEATPAQVGRVVAFDDSIVTRLCKDKDGCDITLAMVNWDPGQPGNVASRKERLFRSETSNWWRVSGNDAAALDNNGSIGSWVLWDCHFTDAETSTGPSNQRADNDIGFGLLNVAGGDYSDALTSCRVTFED